MNQEYLDILDRLGLTPAQRDLAAKYDLTPHGLGEKYDLLSAGVKGRDLPVGMDPVSVRGRYGLGPDVPLDPTFLAMTRGETAMDPAAPGYPTLTGRQEPASMTEPNAGNAPAVRPLYESGAADLSLPPKAGKGYKGITGSKWGDIALGLGVLFNARGAAETGVSYLKGRMAGEDWKQNRDLKQQTADTNAYRAMAQSAYQDESIRVRDEANQLRAEINQQNNEVRSALQAERLRVSILNRESSSADVKMRVQADLLDRWGYYLGADHPLVQKLMYGQMTGQPVELTDADFEMGPMPGSTQDRNISYAQVNEARAGHWGNMDRISAALLPSRIANYQSQSAYRDILGGRIQAMLPYDIANTGARTANLYDLISNRGMRLGLDAQQLGINQQRANTYQQAVDNMGLGGSRGGGFVSAETGAALANRASGYMGSNFGVRGCANYVRTVLNDMGAGIPATFRGETTANAQVLANALVARGGQPVAGGFQPGDVIVMPGRGPSGQHVGIYAGNGQMYGNPGTRDATTVRLQRVPNGATGIRFAPKDASNGISLPGNVREELYRIGVSPSVVERNPDAAVRLVQQFMGHDSPLQTDINGNVTGIKEYHDRTPELRDAVAMLNSGVSAGAPVSGTTPQSATLSRALGPNTDAAAPRVSLPIARQNLAALEAFARSHRDAQLDDIVDSDEYLMLSGYPDLQQRARGLVSGGVAYRQSPAQQYGAMLPSGADLIAMAARTPTRSASASRRGPRPVQTPAPPSVMRPQAARRPAAARPRPRPAATIRAAHPRQVRAYNPPSIGSRGARTGEIRQGSPRTGVVRRPTLQERARRALRNLFD